MCIPLQFRVWAFISWEDSRLITVFDQGQGKTMCKSSRFILLLGQSTIQAVERFQHNFTMAIVVEHEVIVDK